MVDIPGNIENDIHVYIQIPNYDINIKECIVDIECRWLQYILLAPLNNDLLFLSDISKVSKNGDVSLSIIFYVLFLVCVSNCC